MIKAIETIYKGYRFRSRLEARWAVFFDALGIEWEYEPEGFDLGEAGWYLPDFYLPEHKVWIEVKGAEATSDELHKCMMLSLHSVGEEDASDALMTGDGEILKHFIDFAIKECGANPAHAILDAAKCAKERGAVYCLEGLFKNAWLCTSGNIVQCSPESIFIKMLADDIALRGDFWQMSKQEERKKQKETYRALEKALGKSRSARFEHGENP
ncbi:hypothetical protein [uncultured Halomonas sp.]|uniref:hypothetical protein n=1 Tax=uncultured Halomonas sp. TaxID=173971 RepID=UPI00261E7224|nr:hypothetical protein [uncultured Halomonas sp.]